MSERRFELAYERIQEINKNGEIIDVLTDDEVVDLLNSLNEENKRLQIEVKELNRKYNAFYDATNKRLSEMSSDYLVQPYKSRIVKLEEDLLFHKEMKKVLEKANKGLREENERQENEIKLLRKAYSKIPKNIRAVWKE